MSRTERNPIVKKLYVGLTEDQKKLFETAKEIIRINGLSTRDKDVILLCLKSFVEEQQKRLRKQYDKLTKN